MLDGEVIAAVMSMRSLFDGDLSGLFDVVPGSGSHTL